MLWCCLPKPSQWLLVHPGNPHLLAPLAGTWPVGRPRWFTHVSLAAEEPEGGIVAKDIRMGLAGASVSRIAVGERREGAIDRGRVRKRIADPADQRIGRDAACAAHRDQTEAERSGQATR
jgi:hypothetical protein